MTAFKPLAVVIVLKLSLVSTSTVLPLATSRLLEETNNETTLALSPLSIWDDDGTEGDIKLANQSIYLQLLQDDPENPYGLHRMFSGTNFGVRLGLSVVSGARDRDYSEMDVTFILNLVRTRFSRVLLHPVNEKTLSLPGPRKYIPRLAAEINNRSISRNPAELGILLNSLKKPLRISIPFEIELNLDENWRTSFDVAKLLAEEANNIFSGTIEYLLVNIAGPPFTIARYPDSVVEVLQYYKTEMEQIEGLSSSQLGVMFDVQGCRGVNFMKAIGEYVLPHVETVLLEYRKRVGSANILDVYLSAIENLEKCKAQIRDNFPSMKVEFVVEFTFDSSTDSLHGLIEIWQKMNKYALENGIKLFMMEAFDQTNRQGYSGWWRVHSSYLQEKYQVVYNSTSYGSDKDKKGNTKKSEVVIIIVSVLAAVIIFGLVTLLFVVGIRKCRQFTYAAMRRMSEEEILRFFEGRSYLEKEYGTGGVVNESFDYAGITALFESYAYDTGLEITEENFTIDERARLGSGQFGKVCSGTICIAGNELKVAVKQVNVADEVDETLARFRSLLLEIKIMSYIGRHENIVFLLGAYTGNLRRGEVFAFLELCPGGSLQKCLEHLKCFHTDGLAEGYSFLTDNVNPLDKWSYEIANGLEYLTSKHVVHGDIATRNVLLDENKKAKICDFGLSRRMMNNENYMKTHMDSFPWKWMSPECLRFRIFNEKTDVWAFGVTLWEIYTLGDTPYVGQSFDENFKLDLENGVRLPALTPIGPPHSAGKDMYPIMQRCWGFHPEDRPTFQNLKNILLEH